MQGSGEIARHLDRAYPEPPLFASPQEHGLTQFFDKWLGSDILPTLFRICVYDIYMALHEEDQAYFRESREKRLHQSLEETHGQRETYVPVLHQRLQPLRLLLREQAFVGGTEPSYADYMAASAFIWGGSMATIALLPEGDDLLLWLRRCLDLHGGVGADILLPGLPSLTSSGVSR